MSIDICGGCREPYKTQGSPGTRYQSDSFVSTMVSIRIFVLAATAIAGALAAPAFNGTDSITLLSAPAGTPNSNGTHDGYYYSWWTDDRWPGTGYYNNLPGGHYSIEWFGNGNQIGGKGWNPGDSDRYKVQCRSGPLAHVRTAISATRVVSNPTDTATSPSTAGLAVPWSSIISSSPTPPTATHLPRLGGWVPSTATVPTTMYYRPLVSTSPRSTALRHSSSSGLPATPRGIPGAPSAATSARHATSRAGRNMA